MGAMNRRLALATLAALAAMPAFAQDLRPRLPVADAPMVLAGAERASALTQANTTLNAVARLQGRFLQSSPDGSRAAGAFYLQRPGKLRFEYDPPATLLIVSDGSVVSMRDRTLRTTDRTPLRATPLNRIRRSQGNLDHDARITRVARQGQWLQVTARDRSGQTDGEITLYFVGPSTQLASWDVVDATGARTRIVLSNLTQPASLDGGLFRLEDIVQSRPGPRH